MKQHDNAVDSYKSQYVGQVFFPVDEAACQDKSIQVKNNYPEKIRDERKVEKPLIVWFPCSIGMIGRLQEVWQRKYDEPCRYMEYDRKPLIGYSKGFHVCLCLYPYFSS